MKHCGRDAGRLEPYTRPPTTLHAGFTAQPWRCTCQGLRPRQRHTEPQQCVPVAQIEAWRLRTNNYEVSDRTARALCWLTETFGP